MGGASNAEVVANLPEPERVHAAGPCNMEKVRASSCEEFFLGRKDKNFDKKIDKNYAEFFYNCL